MMLKKIFKLKLLILLLSVSCNLNSFSFFADYKANKNYENKDYQSAREILQKEQTDDPNNALINYNLGTIDYKLNKQQSAKNNFQRAVNFTKSNKLKEKAYFNWGNSLCRNSQNILGKGWENKKIDDKKLERATKEFKSAIEKYKNALTLNKENEQAESNLKTVETFIQKLVEKKVEQEQQEKQDGQDQDNNQDNNQDQQKGKSEKDIFKKSDQGDHEFSEDKNGDQECLDDKGDQDGQEQKQEGNKDDASDKQEENKDNGKKDELNKEQGQEKQEKINNHDNNSSEKEEQTQPGEEDTQQEEENQALREEETNAAMQEAQVSEEQESTDLKKREMISLLEKLQDDESKMQKQMLWQKSKSQQRPQNNSQKPW